MTDLDPLLPDDELVSAVLDGEATAEEVARVEADPALRARLEELRRLSTRVATPPPTAPALAAREDLIAAALTAAGRDERDAPESGHVAEVVDLGARRRVPPPWVLGVAAAIAVLVLLAVPLALRDDGTKQDTAAAPTTVVETNAAEGGGERSTDDAAAPSAEADVGAGTEVDAAETAGTDEVFAGEAGPDGSADDGAAIVEDGDAIPAPSLPPDALPATTTVLVVESLGAYASTGEASAAVTAAVDTVLGAERAESATLGGDAAEGAASGTPDGVVDDPALQACIDTVRGADDEIAALVWVATVDLPEGPHHLLLFRLTDTGAENGTHRLYEIVSPACTVIGRTTVS